MNKDSKKFFAYEFIYGKLIHFTPIWCNRKIGINSKFSFPGSGSSLV